MGAKIVRGKVSWEFSRLELSLEVVGGWGPGGGEGASSRYDVKVQDYRVELFKFPESTSWQTQPTSFLGGARDFSETVRLALKF